jgi:hypothetical protein
LHPSGVKTRPGGFRNSQPSLHLQSGSRAGAPAGLQSQNVFYSDLSADPWNLQKERRWVMKHGGLLVVVGLLLFGTHGSGQAPYQSLTITYLYDNTAVAGGTKADGVSRA